MLDIHAHILPGVDDGAKSHRQALQMLFAARDAGIDVLVATPHLRQRGASLSRIADAYYWLKPHAQAAGIHLLLGYEISYCVLLELNYSELGHYCITGTNILLMELDSFQLFPQWGRVLEELVQAGYEPVITHPERYVYIQEHPEIAGEIRRFGCKIQVGAHAFLKPIWDIERRTAGKLKRLKWMDYIASDAHRPQDYKQAQPVMRRLQGYLPPESISLDSALSISSF